MKDEYEYQGVVEGSFDAEFARSYQGGGLLDLRKIDSMSVIFGDSIFLGISQVLQAWFIGTDADIWGDIPYSQADSFSTYPTPALDPQQTVYSEIQTTLSNGIADLQTGTGAGPGGYDLVYNGDATKWIALAHTLKARFYLHTAEQLGTPAYQRRSPRRIRGSARTMATTSPTSPAIRRWRANPGGSSSIPTVRLDAAAISRPGRRSSAI